MRCDELAIEQDEMADLEPRHQPGQGDLRRIGHPAEHRFPKESPSELHAVEAPDQLSVVPAFDRMGVPHRVEPERGPFDHLVDPGLVPVGAGQQHLVKRPIAGHREFSRTHLLGQ